MLRPAAALLATTLALAPIPGPAPGAAAALGQPPAAAGPGQPSAAAAPPPAAATRQDGGEIRWAVQPSGPDGPDGRDWFHFDLAPGTEAVDWVGVTNLGATTMDFAVYPTDAYTTGDGGFALLPGGEPPRDLGAWVSLDAGRYRVPPGQRLDIPFRLTVPANASPGDHAGGIVAAVTARQTGADGRQVDLDRRVAARIYLRVAGPARPAVAIESLALAYAGPLLPWADPTLTVRYVLRNTGNLRVTGAGRVRVTGPFGWRLAGAGGELPELLPGSAVTVTETISGVAPAGRLAATVTVDPVTIDGPLPPVSRTAAGWAPPWWLLAALLLVVGAVVTGRWWLRRRHATGRRAHPG